MFNYKLFLISFLVLAVVSGCQGGTNKVEASLDNEFTLTVGQIAELRGEQITIQFEGIQEDSRCPKGAACIWQGRVRSVLQINHNGLSSRLILTESGLSNEYGRDTYKQYEFTSHIQPYPEIGKEILSKDYRLYLLVKKIPASAN